MKAYRCDICGKYCDDVYENAENTLCIFPSAAMAYGIGEKKIEIHDMCEECFVGLQKFIITSYIENHRERKSN